MRCLNSNPSQSFAWGRARRCSKISAQSFLSYVGNRPLAAFGWSFPGLVSPSLSSLIYSQAAPLMWSKSMGGAKTNMPGLRRCSMRSLGSRGSAITVPVR